MATGIPRSRRNGQGPKSPLNGGDLFLHYPGKQPTEAILARPAASTRRLWAHSPDAANRLYYGENAAVLAALLKEGLAGQVHLVYIDPPFATRSAFESRTQELAYEDLLAGAEYLEFLRERLILLRELLADNGSLYLHLDETMVFYAKVVLDEVFGAKNFRNCIVRKKCNPKNYTRKAYGNVVDYILFYTKTGEYTWNKLHEEWTSERAKEYQYVEPETGRRYMKVPVHAPGVRNGETGQSWRGMLPPPGKHWQYSPRKLDEMDARGEIFWSATGNPRRKVYLDESPGVSVQDLWLDFRDAHNQNIRVTGYPTEKNGDLLRRIIAASSNEGDIVFDCFAGSGTTLEAASEMCRRWIGVDNSAAAIKSTLHRFAKGSERMGQFRQTAAAESEREQRDLFAPITGPTPVPERKPIVDFALLAERKRGIAGEDVLRTWQALLAESAQTEHAPSPRAPRGVRQASI